LTAVYTIPGNYLYRSIMPTLHLLIKGKVQGVFYRATAKEMAEKIGIKGWIKNTPSGDVEAVVTGNEQELAEFTSWCKQGPRRANVTEVISTQREHATFEDFSVIRQAE
jgi:acylphosphatase